MGNINVFTGPMKCGKSKNLIEEANKQKAEGEIINCSDNVKMLTAKCECCHINEATYTYCKVEKTGDILIGDSCIYASMW